MIDTVAGAFAGAVAAFAGALFA
jgi:hypothetical protein